MRFSLRSWGGPNPLDVSGGPRRSSATSHASTKPCVIKARQVSLASATALKSPVTMTALPGGSAATRVVIIVAASSWA